METNYLTRLFNLADKQNVQKKIALETLERKIDQYIVRDAKLNKPVHYFYPLQQYHRAIDVMEGYYRRKEESGK